MKFSNKIGVFWIKVHSNVHNVQIASWKYIVKSQNICVYFADIIKKNYLQNYLISKETLDFKVYKKDSC